ncbi:MAG TPA: hypothetical protein PKC31_00875 [Candidatus Nanoperiomorbaceae bacterium]|nr:hypothetical protein [Candidatus Nanoperiomorbaceae bacterium]
MLLSKLLPARLLVQPGAQLNPLAAVPMTSALSDPDVHYYLGNLGVCTGQKRLVVFALDDSPSMTGAGGNDPLSRRYAEARLAVRTLVRACSCEQEMVAVYHWDKSRFDVPPVGFDPTSNWRVQGGLRVPDDVAGTSELGPVLTRIERAVRPWAWRGWDVHLVVLSDFELLDADLGGVVRQLQRFADRHAATAVVLGSHAPDPRLLDGAVSLLPITSADRPGTLARAVFGVLSRGRTGYRI